jgi:hypothetical protein
MTIFDLPKLLLDFPHLHIEMNCPAHTFMLHVSITKKGVPRRVIIDCCADDRRWWMIPQNEHRMPRLSWMQGLAGGCRGKKSYPHGGMGVHLKATSSDSEHAARRQSTAIS